MSVAKQKLFSGAFKEAYAAAQDLLRAEPGNPQAVLVMAAIAIEHGNQPAALRLVELLEKAGVKDCWLEVLKARIALLRQDQEGARRHAMSAAALGTDDADIANQLGVVLSRTGHHEEAVAPLRIAVEKTGDNTDHRYNFAVALQFAGELAEAEEQFRELVRQDPSHARGWLALAQLAKTPEEEWLLALSQQFDASSDTEQRLLIGHALARIEETRKDWDSSFEWLQKAKEAKRAEVGHDREFAGRVVDAAIASIDAQPIASTPSGDERPIFIVGMPRSGTTLVERILTSHSQVTSVGELSDFAIVLKKFLDTPGPMVLDAEVLEAAAAREDLTPVGDAYRARAEALAGDEARYIDKMPFNSFFVPAILRANPGARVICLRRSPHDLLMANYRQLFATGFSYYSYSYDLEDTAHFIAGFERMASAYEASLPPDRFMAIRYEDVVADQRGKTEALLDFCGLEWEEACMQFQRNAEPVATASSVQVRSPIYSSSIGQWRRYTAASAQVEGSLAKFGVDPDEG
ncbi:tetratricopeptide repeat-containing sulfotransferase family protein [Qipengyuania aquimaris]|uniref:tetratricopeptide repeat-containing sulfotransferase family protein n=1 Tax=Qipengyuania aquimaris TaxID=255984 RepID=UPI001FD22FD6|nr:sulfotransferase [Qipengyuania aquimaris]UOR15770.1 sulfotransferase [Qipengyuania aquimaris]